MYRLIIIILLVASGAAQATTITIDFDDLTPGIGQGSTGAFFSTQDFDISTCCSNNDGVVASGAPGNNIVQALSVEFHTGPHPGEIGISRMDGEAFAFYSADLVGAERIFVQTSIGGGFSAADLNGAGAGDWLSVLSVTFISSGGFFRIVTADNIVVGSAVPIPAAAWLFGSGLGLLGWLRRRTTA